jgi:hypothetical protein
MCCPLPSLAAQLVTGHQRNGMGGPRLATKRSQCEPRRGSIRTCVPPSSIDRSAPRSISSRYAATAVATLLTELSESRSCMRICTTLGVAPALAARIAEKSEIVRDKDERVFGGPRQDLDVRRRRRTDGGPVDGLEPVTPQAFDPAWRQVHVHEQLHGLWSGTSTSSARQAA